MGKNELLCFKPLKVPSLYCFSRCVTGEGGHKCIQFLTIKLKPFLNMHHHSCSLLFWNNLEKFLFSVTDTLLSVFLSISLFLISLATALTFLPGSCTQWLHEDRGGNAWLQRATESLHRPEQSSKTAQDLGQPASRMEGWEDPNKRGSQKYEEVRDDTETRLQRNSGRWRQKDSGNVVKYILGRFNLGWPEDSRIWWFIGSLSDCNKNTITKYHKVLF